jgi:tetratricopeptide (TPR) repeat protein
MMQLEPAVTQHEIAMNQAISQLYLSAGDFSTQSMLQNTYDAIRLATDVNVRYQLAINYMNIQGSTLQEPMIEFTDLIDIVKTIYADQILGQEDRDRLLEAIDFDTPISEIADSDRLDLHAVLLINVNTLLYDQVLANIDAHNFADYITGFQTIKAELKSYAGGSIASIAQQFADFNSGWESASPDTRDLMWIDSDQIFSNIAVKAAATGDYSRAMQAIEQISPDEINKALGDCWRAADQTGNFAMLRPATMNAQMAERYETARILHSRDATAIANHGNALAEKLITGISPANVFNSESDPEFHRNWQEFNGLLDSLKQLDADKAVELASKALSLCKEYSAEYDIDQLSNIHDIIVDTISSSGITPEAAQLIHDSIVSSRDDVIFKAQSLIALALKLSKP